MALSIDISRALRTVSQRQHLVAAIRDAPADDPETDSVEWKGGVDLTEKKWQAEIARQVIGFANRHPGRAAATWGGCAYLVVGADPETGRLSRVTDRFSRSPDSPRRSKVAPCSRLGAGRLLPSFGARG